MAGCGVTDDIVSFLAELKTTFQLPILGVKKNPQSPLYTSLGEFRSRCWSGCSPNLPRRSDKGNYFGGQC